MWWTQCLKRGQVRARWSAGQASVKRTAEKAEEGRKKVKNQKKSIVGSRNGNKKMGVRTKLFNRKTCKADQLKGKRTEKGEGGAVKLSENMKKNPMVELMRGRRCA